MNEQARALVAQMQSGRQSENTQTALADTRLEIEQRMARIQRENEETRQQINLIDAQRNQLATLSQQQQGAYSALKDLLDALPGD